MSFLLDILYKILGRVVALGVSIEARLTSPGTWQQLAPVVAVLGATVAWWFWRRAGQTALGRALRWWVGVVSLAGFVAPPIYFRVVLPDGAAGLVAVEINASRLGRAQYPAEVVATALAVMIASGAWYLWGWRQSRTSFLERHALTTEWRQARDVIGRTIRVVAMFVVIVFAVVMSAGLVGAREAPNLGSVGTLWVSTANGVNRLQMGTDGISRMETFAWPSTPLPSNEVGSIAVGPGGEIWVGTTRGVALRGPGSDAPWVTYDVEDGSLPNRQVFQVAVDRRGVGWVATASGGASIDPRRGAYHYIARNAPLLHNILDTVHVDAMGRVWFGGAGGVNAFVPSTAVPMQASAADITRSEEAPVGGGVGSWAVGLTRYNTDGALPDTLVFTITSDRQGRIWFGTENGAASLRPDATNRELGAYDPRNWRTFTMRNSGLVHPKVHAIAEDRDGRIWFGTEGGITILDERVALGSPGRWQSFVTGLPHPWVQALTQTPDGRMWVGTRGGGLAVARIEDPAEWVTFTAHPARQLLGMVIPWMREGMVASNDVRHVTWVTGDKGR